MRDQHGVGADPGEGSGNGLPGGDQSSLLFIGTATTLIRHSGFALLTDPNFLHLGQRAYLGRGMWSRRLTEPAMTVDALPELDAVVLSHMHGDHWDRVARKGLDRSTPIVTTPHAARHLALQGFGNRRPLRTWEHSDLVKGNASVSITAMPGRHARGPLQAILPPVMGSMLEFRRDGHLMLRMYISGDTLMYAGLAEIRRRYPVIQVGLLHLGGTKLPGGMVVTMDARQGADLTDLIDARITVPIHYDDYGRFASPLSDFRDEVARRGRIVDVAFLDRGQSLALPVA
ncbi:MAG: hypothetical protein JWN20_2324 [Jatrophihabitantaceae bacterium]|nr:hypothetical protein [Jatrophihabitantaceae bacterium]